MNNNLDSFNEIAKRKAANLQQEPVMPAYVAKSHDASGVDPKIVAYHEPRSPICEGYRAIFTHLKQNLAQHDSRLFAITSAQKNEGKTITALNLSVVIARDYKKKVLLVEGNLRNPIIDKLMNLNADEGLSNILSADIDYKKIIQASAIPNLFIITAGKKVHNTVELLHSERLKPLLERLKLDFDYIIIDTPSIISCADTKILAPLVDGVILTIKARGTRREVVDRAEVIIKEMRAKLLGFILTDIEYYIPDFIYRHL